MGERRREEFSKETLEDEKMKEELMEEEYEKWRKERRKKASWGSPNFSHQWMCGRMEEGKSQGAMEI